MVLTAHSTYQTEVNAELTRILDFWATYSLDHQGGGFIGRMNNDGHVATDAPKGGVLNARILWTFSAAYRHTRNPAYRTMADRAYDYLRTHFLDEAYGGVYWSVDAQGRPLGTRKQIYGLAFALYGFSEYYRATANPAALETAIALFDWIEKHSFDPAHGGYFEAFSREGTLLDDLRLSEKDRNDPKTMNTHLHILEGYTNLYRVWPNARLAGQLTALLGTFLDHIVDPVTNHMNLFFTADWQPTADLISYGHDIEASWLLPEAAGVLNNNALTGQVNRVAVAMARAAAEGLQPDGSLYHELDKASGHVDTHREWWVSAEAMVGFLNAYQLTGEETFLTQSMGSWQFTKDHLLDHEQGEWRWGVLDDQSPMRGEDKIGFWKCPYHNARACLEVYTRLREQTERVEKFV
ncbi:AGE family epimerase/isomerase [Spirosoma arcticum]